MSATSYLLRELHVGDAALMIDHFNRLPAHDRQARFRNESVDINDYVKNIDFENDRIFAAFKELALVGIVHLGLNRKTCVAEVGISVDSAHRKQGCASSLMAKVLNYVIDNHYDLLYISCSPSNSPMIHFAKKIGGTMKFEDCELNATVDIPALTKFLPEKNSA